MASLQSSSLLQTHCSSSSSRSKSNRRVSGAASMQLLTTESMKTMLMQELRVRNNNNNNAQPQRQRNRKMDSEQKQQMYLILEEIADRIEMHTNIGKQRENWNSLLLNSINMMTLTGVLSSAAATTEGTTAGTVILFGAATGMLLIMNKIQPSQLAEEQRNAVRLFKELKTEMESKLLNQCTKAQVDEMMKKVLALDRAYPLPLLGKMLEKFPKKLQSAVWWPKCHPLKLLGQTVKPNCPTEYWCNGWTEELEMEMRAIADILKTKDEADYLRLGNIALNTNKVLAISGPLLTGFATAATITHAPTLAAMTGALAVAVNTFQHAGQVGMVVEMYRNCAGFFRMMEESIKSTLEESDLDKRENGELFERKVALKLGRSLSQLRHLAATSKSVSSNSHHQVDEFGSKLF